MLGPNDLSPYLARTSLTSSISLGISSARRSLSDWAETADEAEKLRAERRDWRGLARLSLRKVFVKVVVMQKSDGQTVPRMAAMTPCSEKSSLEPRGWRATMRRCRHRSRCRRQCRCGWLAGAVWARNGMGSLNFSLSPQRQSAEMTEKVVVVLDRKKTNWCRKKSSVPLSLFLESRGEGEVKQEGGRGHSGQSTNLSADSSAGRGEHDD